MIKIVPWICFFIEKLDDSMYSTTAPLVAIQHGRVTIGNRQKLQTSEGKNKLETK